MRYIRQWLEFLLESLRWRPPVEELPVSVPVQAVAVFLQAHRPLPPPAVEFERSLAKGPTSKPESDRRKKSGDVVSLFSQSTVRMLTNDRFSL